MSTSEKSYSRREPITDGGMTPCSRKRNYSSLEATALIIFALVVSNNLVEALPFPAPDLKLCGMAFNTTEICCTLPSGIGPLKKFDFTKAHLPMRVRRAAHLVDDAYIEKYQKAVELMRALPETDGRSFTAQTRLHCAYCNNHLYFEGNVYPLEIHQSWLFLPWHRLFVFFHERILAKLIGDDDFALPFWNFDSQDSTAPFPNVVPQVYAHNVSYSPDAINKTSSLWDPDRNPCSAPPRLVEFQDFIACNPRPFTDQTRLQNAHLMWTQMVSVGVTPLVMAGGEYRFGDYGGRGIGAIEARPHGPVHAWTNVRDMGTFRNAASDPIFFALHGNIDRLWELWRTLPGKYRKDVTDPDYLNTAFTFFNEDGDQVTATVGDVLDINRIRIKYQEVPNAWVTKGSPQVNTNPSWKFCNPKPSEAHLARLIAKTRRFKAPLYVQKGPVTFKLKRRPNLSERHGEEILELKAKFVWQQVHSVDVYAYLPNATYETTSIGCVEYLGNVQSLPHPGMSPDVAPEMTIRIGIRRKLELMGRAHLHQLVLTLVGQSYASPLSPGEAGFDITSAKIIYSTE